MRERTTRPGRCLQSFLPSSYKGNYIKILVEKVRFPWHPIGPKFGVTNLERLNDQKTFSPHRVKGRIKIGHKVNILLG